MAKSSNSQKVQLKKGGDTFKAAKIKFFDS